MVQTLHFKCGHYYSDSNICHSSLFYFYCKEKKYPFRPLTGDEEFDNRVKRASKKKKKRGKLNKHEEECRRIFQETFGVKFKSVRPDWLRNPVTGKNLELDGFNEGIKTHLGTGLAFEYDGKQHSEYNSHFHKGGPDEFVYQVKKDNWKDMKCKEKGIILIRIPHFVAFNDLRRYITRECSRLKINIPVGASYGYGDGGNMYG